MIQPIELTTSKVSQSTIHEAVKLAESVMSEHLTYRVEIRLVPDGMAARKQTGGVSDGQACTA